MTQTTTSDLDLLRSMLTGRVTGPDDAGYDDARRVWNADVDHRPAVVAQCLGANVFRLGANIRPAATASEPAM